MEKTKVVLCDTNIIIEFYKGNAAILKSLRSIGQENIAVSIVTFGELIYGAINKTDLSKINKDIAHLQILFIDQDVYDRFLKIMISYSLSHNLSLPDGFIATAAIANNIPLYTLNRKDFRYIKELKLWK